MFQPPPEFTDIDPALVEKLRSNPTAVSLHINVPLLWHSNRRFLSEGY